MTTKKKATPRRKVQKVKCTNCVQLGKLCMARDHWYCPKADKNIKTAYTEHECKHYMFYD